MKALHSLRDRLFSGQTDLDDIAAWRARVLSVVMLVMAILGTVAAVPSIALSVVTQFWSVAATDTVALIWILVLWRKQSLPYRFRAWNLLVLVYLLGTLLLFKVGHAAQIYLMAVPVFAALLLGPKPAIAALILNAVTLGLGGYLVDADIVVARYEAMPQIKWAVISVNFLLVDSLITFSTIMLLAGLERSLNRKRDSERRFRLLTEWTPEAMGVHRAGKILYVNPAGVRLLGAQTLDELVGRNLLDFVHADDRQAVIDRIASTPAQVERGEPGVSAPIVGERILRLDGVAIDCEVRRIPIEYDGAPAVQIAIRDITERKRAEQERSDLERKLLQAQKMEAVGNLTGGIAHDINNLLGVLLGRLEMIQDELADRPALREWVEACVKAVNGGATLTRSLLAFSRRQPLQPVRIEVPTTLHEIVRLLRRTLGDPIEIKEVYPSDLWACDADPAQLQTALLNLALNARDAMPEGGKLTIDARNQRLEAMDALRAGGMTEGEYVVISVTDTGTGMPPETVDRVFEPFFTTKETGKGTGLGLSMVYGYVKQSGGHIKIYSEVGSGTTVSLYFLRAKTAEAGAAEAAKGKDAAPKKADTRSQGGRESILLVEDEHDMRDLVTQLLERLGYTVYGARTAEDAWPLLEAHKEIVLLLTDISLPGGMNGRKLADRAQEIRPGLKVLFMSGYSAEAVIHQGRLDPGLRLLQKPFHINDLATHVRAALAEGRTEQTAK